MDLFFTNNFNFTSNDVRVFLTFLLKLDKAHQTLQLSPLPLRKNHVPLGDTNDRHHLVSYLPNIYITDCKSRQLNDTRLRTDAKPSLLEAFFSFRNAHQDTRNRILWCLHVPGMLRVPISYTSARVASITKCGKDLCG